MTHVLRIGGLSYELDHGGGIALTLLIVTWRGRVLRVLPAGEA